MGVLNIRMQTEGAAVGDAADHRQGELVIERIAHIMELG
jgi:hypothetical protein